MKQLVVILIGVAWMFGEKLNAQADISMATHWYNRANYNPASIARPDYTYIFSNVRQQWAGVSGAPQIANVQASQYVENMKSAFGLSVVEDKVGATQALNPMLSYAYRMSKKKKRSAEWALSMGLSAGIFARSINGSVFDATTDVDPSFQYSTERIFRPDVNVGAEFQYSNYIFGLSSTHLLSLFSSGNLLLNTNHRYAYAIYQNNKSDYYNYHAGLQVINRYNQTVVEANGGIRIKKPTGLIKGPKELFDLGVTLRSSKQVTLLFGLNLNANLRMGYAYNQSFLAGYYANGTHELMLEYRIPFYAPASKSKYGYTGYWYH